MNIDHYSLSILRHVYSRKGCDFGSLKAKFDGPNFKDAMEYLRRSNLISISRLGFAATDIGIYQFAADSSLITCTVAGNWIVESNRWFTWKYAVTNILIPIIVGILSAVITAILLGALTPSP